MSEIAQPTLVNNASFSALPQELIQALNQTYFLHLLVTDPQMVLPPGKSLLSMMTHANFKVSNAEPEEANRAKVLNRVKEVAHRAFWNEALEQLSSPLPSVQITRLKQLYLDLHESLVPLFPPNHPILTALSSPLPPTSSPLRTTINLLIEILEALLKRCAPVRDQNIDDILVALSHPPSPRHLDDTSDASYRSQIAELVIDKLKAILILAEDIKADLNTFVLGSMTESQLQLVLLNEVKIREREFVSKVWGGKDVINGLWRSWVSESSSPNHTESVDKKWIKRLFRALESDQAIHSLLPSSVDPLAPDGEQPNMDSDTLSTTTKDNKLPPQLFFSTPSLVNIQNHLQAIVIAAALRALTRLTPQSGSPSPKLTSTGDFLPRIWALLEAEINYGERNGAGEDVGDNDRVGHTRLINLADEVVRARRGMSAQQDTTRSPPPLNPEEEKRLREAVDRTLQSTDPVFLLLKKRLVGSIEKRVLFLAASITAPAKSNQALPTKMQTGTDILQDRTGKRPRLNIPESLPPGEASNPSKNVEINMDSIIPGFEDIILQKEIHRVLGRIIGVVGWVEVIWGEMV